MAVEITDGTIKGKIFSTINPEVKEIPITVNTIYADWGRAVRIGKIVFVTIDIIKVIGAVDGSASSTDYIVSGLPPARDFTLHTMISNGGHTIRVAITGEGKMKEHWTHAWQKAQGDELEETLIYVSQ